MFAKLINMARSAAEVKKDLADMPCVVGESKYEGPKYPYGLCISLDEDALKKLGLEGDLPGVGDELQITDMGIPGAHQADRDVDRSEQRRARFYGDPAKADVSADD
jgi:hypothetical protein